MSGVFTGEMQCCMCPAKKQGDPGKNSQWRALQVSGVNRMFYACEAHFPPDGSSVEAFKAAYASFIRHITAILEGAN